MTLRRPSRRLLDVDELRQQLRSLGYLDAGRRSLRAGAGARHARAGRRWPRARACASGCLAALLLGPAAAIGLGARLPGLVSGVRDALVLALYLGAGLFRVAVTAVRVRRQPRRIALVARTRRAVRAQRARGCRETPAAIITLALPRLPDVLVAQRERGFGWSAPVWTRSRWRSPSGSACCSATRSRHDARRVLAARRRRGRTAAGRPCDVVARGHRRRRAGVRRRRGAADVVDRRPTDPRRRSLRR